MIRFLNLLILSLTTWHDVRSKISLSITAMGLTGVGTLIVVTTVAADTFSRPALTYHRQSVAATPSSNETPTVSSQRRALSLVARSPAISPPATTNSATDEHSKTAGTAPTSPQPTSESLPQPSSAAQTALDQTNASPQKNSLQMTQPQLFCDLGKSAWRIISARLVLQTPLANSSTLIWSWESRMDSASTDTTPVNPVPTDQFSQAVTANATSITLTASDSSQPLLTGPASGDYAFSLRLHVTAPIDITSDWVSVPHTANVSCQSGPS